MSESGEERIEAVPKVDDGDLVVEFGDGTELRLEVTVSEWTHESPKHGSSVEMEAEVEHFDEHVYWHLFPERSDPPSIEPEDFPLVEITPSVSPGDGGATSDD